MRGDAVLQQVVSHLLLLLLLTDPGSGSVTAGVTVCVEVLCMFSPSSPVSSHIHRTRVYCLQIVRARARALFKALFCGGPPPPPFDGIILNRE